MGPRCGTRRGTSATAWYERGCALEATDPEGAEHAFRRALAGRPDFADAHNNLGRLLHARHDAAATPPHDAEAHYRLAICANPTIALYWFNLGVAVEDLGRFSEAVRCYERALELEPTLADAHYNLARLYETIGRSSLDELVLRRAIRHLTRYRSLVA